MNDQLTKLVDVFSDAMNTLEDENGVFDKRKEPARALVLLEGALEHHQMMMAVLEQALVTLLKDGESVAFDGSSLFEGGGTIKVYRHEDHLHMEAIDPPTTPDAAVGQTYVQKVAELQKQIYAEQYYVERYQDALRANTLSNTGVEAGQYDSGTLSEMLNDFWFSLPDSPSIRTGPFFLLCDLCEGDPETA